MVRLLAIVLMLICQAAWAQPGPTPLQRRLLDSVAVQDVPPGAPGIATVVIQHRRVIYQKTAGYADLTDSSLIGADTRFNIASNGKQFTALAVLTLIESNKVKLSDDIRAFFPGLLSGIKDTITVQSLLNHTSGLRDCYDLWNLQGLTWWEQTFSNEDVLKLLMGQQALNFKPGSEYLYSNTNYILLALLVEKLSGKGFVEYTNQLFRKLNMPNTSFESNYKQIRGPIARAYFNFGTWTTYNWIWNVCGDGNLFTTLNDQIQWEILLQGGGKTPINRQWLAKSQQPLPLSNFPNYGYGLEFGTYKGLEYAFHEGATGAWKATVLRFPSKETTLLTLTNTGKSIPSMQTRQMADILFSLRSDAAYLVTKPERIGDPVRDEEIPGIYLTESGFAFEFENRENKIFLKRSGRNDVELEREAANIFHQKFDPPFKQEFTRKADGTLQVTAYYINHAPYTLTRQYADFSSFQFTRLNGKYRNQETGSEMTIGYQSGLKYSLKIGTNDPGDGILVTPEKLLFNGYTLEVQNSTSSTARIYLNGDRISRVEFVRIKD